MAGLQSFQAMRIRIANSPSGSDIFGGHFEAKT